MRKEMKETSAAWSGDAVRADAATLATWFGRRPPRDLAPCSGRSRSDQRGRADSLRETMQRMLVANFESRPRHPRPRRGHGFQALQKYLREAERELSDPFSYRHSAQYGFSGGGARTRTGTLRDPPREAGQIFRCGERRRASGPSARRFVRAGRADLQLIQRVEVALINHPVIVDIEVGGCPKVVWPFAGLGILDGLRQFVSRRSTSAWLPASSATASCACRQLGQRNL